MATATFAPCPHCKLPLTYLEGVTGSTLNPLCPRCKVAVTLKSATFLMADYSRPTRDVKQQRKRRAAAAQ